MKNLFSVEVKTGEQPDNKYVVKKTDSSVFEKQENVMMKVGEFQKKYSLPWYFKVIMYICAFAAAVIFLGTVNAVIDGASFSKAYKNAPYLFYICGASLLIFLLLWGISRYLIRKGEKDPQLQIVAQQVENTVSESFESLGVPAEAAEISVIVYLFKIKKGKRKPFSPFVSFNAHEMKIYSDGEKLYLADIDSVTAIPFTDIKEIAENKKRSQITEWTKDESFRSKKYKPFKIRSNGYYYFVKTYSLKLNSDGEESEIIIPNYDLQVLQNYVDAPVVALKTKEKKRK